MAISDLLAEAGLLMLIGMIVVFVFLTILIFATTLLSKFAGTPVTASLPNGDKASSSVDNNSSIKASAPVVAAISAAIKTYKQNNK